jgi:hypothetical protein
MPSGENTKVGAYLEKLNQAPFSLSATPEHIEHTKIIIP